MASAQTSVVLIGAGHAHLHLLKHAALFKQTGSALTLIDPGLFWYSGLATGMLGGQFDKLDDTLQPRALADRYGISLFQTTATCIDRDNQTVHLTSGDAIHYDALSINVGSEVALPSDWELTDDMVTVKPIGNLWTLRSWLEARFKAASRTPVNITVLGGGATGCEIAANIDALARRHGGLIRILLISRSHRLMEETSKKVSRIVQGLLEKRGIQIALDSEIADIAPNRLTTSRGQVHCWDKLVLATGLSASRLIGNLSLSTDKDGLVVDRTLRSIDDAKIFGAGDCISLQGYDLPKLGVFAVRQSPVLLHNLLAAITQGSTKNYCPQRHHLSILNLGCGKGLALWNNFYWYGRLSSWLKNYLDLKFLANYKTL